MLQAVERARNSGLSGEQLGGGEDPKDSIDKVHSEKKPALPARDVSHSQSSREQNALRGLEQQAVAGRREPVQYALMLPCSCFPARLRGRCVAET